MTRFEQALAFVERMEGGWSDDPSDPGGETKYGISQAAHPTVDIATLTREQAAEIYRREYWDKLSCEDIPEPLDEIVFDTAVNCGVGSAGIWLIEILNESCGAELRPPRIGSATIDTLVYLDDEDMNATVMLYFSRRLRHYASLPRTRNGKPYRDRYLAGWVRRVAALMEEVL